VIIMPSTVTAADMSMNFGAYQDAAAREPVIVTKNGRPRTVLMAYEDYLRLTRRERRVELTSELADVEIDAVESARLAQGGDSGIREQR
jgi:prevent-host-death family protein